MIRTLLLTGGIVLLAAGPPAAQEPAPPLSPRIAGYEIDARLDPGSKIVSGTEVLTWRNATSHPAPDLLFHLYYNGWRNTHSSFLRRYGSDGGSRLADLHDDEWAYCEVHSVRILALDGRAEEDLTGAIEYVQPDDGNAEDRTVMRVPLASPVAPGETVRVEIRWDSKVPRTFARTGFIADYFFIAQWFPKIGVLNPDGTWNCHQFISTEFFADFGVYDVRLSVPTGWTVGATGREIDFEVHPDGTTTHRFVQEDVHDFAWTASPYFRDFRARFEEAGLPPVDMRLLLMPDHLAHRERYFAAARATLRSYGTWFGPYPYGHLTIVDPAYQSRTGGMEYPTLFTGGTRWLSPRETLSPEGVTLHECGHQFWYGIVANNEFEQGWMDEGFNTFSTSRTMLHAFGGRVLTRRYLDGFLPFVFRDIPVADRASGADRFYGLDSPLKTERMSTPTIEQDSPRVHAYDKPALMLRTLENHLGEDTFLKVMSAYFEHWKFRHPRPEDFFEIASDVSGQDLTWFFEATWNSSDVFDYGVASVTTLPAGPPRGFVEKGGKLELRNQKTAQPDEKDEDVEEAPGETRVMIRRYGEGIFPLEIRVTFEDGHTVLERWDGKARWKRFVYDRPSRVSAVEVDPNRVLVLDVDRTNNSWVREPKARLAGHKWASKWMIWLQNLLEQMAFFS